MRRPAANHLKRRGLGGPSRSAAAARQLANPFCLARMVRALVGAPAVLGANMAKENDAHDFDFSPDFSPYS